VCNSALDNLQAFHVVYRVFSFMVNTKCKRPKEYIQNRIFFCVPHPRSFYKRRGDIRTYLPGARVIN
jgi:hypothetical protein